MSHETKDNFTQLKALPLLPKNFDPLVADKETLAHFGFPRRPDRERAPEAFEFWRRLFANPLWKTRIHPNFVIPNRSISNPVNSGPPPSTSGNFWSGAVLLKGEISDIRYELVVGTWTVPNLTIPAGYDKDGPFLVSEWVGLDGYIGDSATCVQAGVTQGINLHETDIPFVTGSHIWTELPPVPLCLHTRLSRIRGRCHYRLRRSSGDDECCGVWQRD